MHKQFVCVSLKNLKNRIWPLENSKTYKNLEESQNAFKSCPFSVNQDKKDPMDYY